jgi:hypothetical protein
VLQATCPWLRAFATQLREKYDQRFALIARNATNDELRDVEAEVFRVNRLMTSHRRRCPDCTQTRTVVTPIRRPRAANLLRWVN